VGAPLQNKLGRLLTSPLLRNILCQKSTISISNIMDRGGLFIASLAKGTIGEDTSKLLGSLLVAAFHLAAMQRANQREENRKYFYMFLDEFHNYGGDTFISTLSEARKYRLSLILANQFIDQLSVPLQKATLSNVGTMISFGIGPSDAGVLSEFLSYSPETLSSINPYEICVRGLGEGREV